MGEKIPQIVILCEGVDLSGKSTLMDGLCKAYPAIVIKNTYRPHSKDKKEQIEYQKHLYCILDFINHNRKTKSILLDRFFPSEIVYSKVMRGYEAFDNKAYAGMEKVITALPHLYVYCNPHYDVLIERFKQRGDDYISEKNIKALSERYDRFFRKTKMNKIELDTSKPIQELLEIVKKKLDEYK